MSSSLTELVQQKEKEWKEVQELRVQSLESALQENERHLGNERIRFKKLREDFEYNLKLLEDRDSELRRYDALFSEVKSIHNRRDGEVSELKIQLDELRVKLHHGEKTRGALQSNYQQRIREHQQELNKFRLAKDAEVKQEREQFENFKRELQNQLRAAEEDVEMQREELVAGFDEAMRKREHEFRLKADDMSSALLASEIKVKMLTKELELLRVTDQKSKDELEESETSVQDLEKKLKQKEWELTDERNMSQAKITDLETQIQQLKASMHKAQLNFQHKFAEIDRYAREKEASLLAAKESHHERERNLEETVRQLQSQMETDQVEYRRLEWSHKDALKEKELQEQRLQAIAADLKGKLDTQAAEHARSIVARDLELETLRQQEEKMRLEITQRKEDIERYKRELAMAVERECSFERVKSQLEADWQRRCEDTEREVYEKQEELIRNLGKARNEAVALSKERERELAQRDDLIRALTQTKDQAFATLQRHGLSIPAQLPNKDRQKDGPSESAATDNQNLSSKEKMRTLESQNENLRAVIRQMRDDMEDLNNQLASRPPSVMMQTREREEGSSVPLTTEYVTSLEKEIRELKTKNRALVQRAEELSQAAKPPPGHEATQRGGVGKPDDPYIQCHVKELNSIIGYLRQEKSALSAQVKKQEATVAHLQSLVNQAQEESRQKQLSADQLQYELSTQSRRATDETAALKQRLAEMELQLTQTRREADEYYKSGLERNAQATSLSNQLSSLKLDLATQGKTASSFDPQSAVIRQLQDEVQQLRSQLKMDPRPDPAHDAIFAVKPGQGNVARLQGKLKVAAQRIDQLAREKEQLIQMGNRLRAELARHTNSGCLSSRDRGATSVSAPQAFTKTSDSKVSSKTPGQIADQLQSKLSAVEKLQYQLTSHELQFAQRRAEQELDAAEKARITVKSSSSETSPSEGNDNENHRDVRAESRDSRPSKAVGMSNPATKLLETAIPGQQTSSPLTEGPLFTSSSEGQTSLQEIWRLLDNEESFRSPSTEKARFRSPEQERPGTQVPDHIPANSGSWSDGFTLKGQRTEIESKPGLQRPNLSKRAAGKARSKLVPKKGKVRNYNVKSD